MLQADDRTPLLQVVKTCVAASLAWVVCLAILPGQLPVFGAIAAILVVQPSVNQSFAKGLERTVGVIVGVVIAYLVGLVFGPSTWIVLLAILLALLTGWVLRLSQSTTTQLPISAMLVLTIGAQTPGYAGGRIIETALGAVMAVIINLVVVPPVRLQPAHDAVAALGRETARCLDTLARLIERPSTEAERSAALVEVRLIAPMLAKAKAEVTAAEESLRFNPRRKAASEAIELDDDLIAMLGVIAQRVPGMVRGSSTITTSPCTTSPPFPASSKRCRRPLTIFASCCGSQTPTAPHGGRQRRVARSDGASQGGDAQPWALDTHRLADRGPASSSRGDRRGGRERPSLRQGPFRRRPLSCGAAGSRSSRIHRPAWPPPPRSPSPH